MTGQERRQQLLDVGRRLFAERGFEGTSIEEIAAQAGVSKPVVYEHFGGKEGLYAVVVDREVERLTMAATVLLDRPYTKPKFEAAAVSLLRYIEENADGFRILVRDSSPASGSGTYGTLLADIAGQVDNIMADFLTSRGRDPGLAPMYSQMMVGMVAFTGQWWLDARKPALEQVAKNLIDLAWGGLEQLDARPSAGGLPGRRRPGGDGHGALGGRRGRQLRRLPGLVAAGHVGGPRKAEVLQRGGGQAGGVPLGADDDRPQAVPGGPGQPRAAGRVEAPFQVVPLDHHRARDLAGGGPLGGGPDVDQHRARFEFGVRLVRCHPGQPGARLRQDVVDGPGAGWPAGRSRTLAVCAHQSPVPSVPIGTRPPGVRSYLVMADSGGE